MNTSANGTANATAGSEYEPTPSARPIITGRRKRWPGERTPGTAYNVCAAAIATKIAPKNPQLARPIRAEPAPCWIMRGEKQYSASAINAHNGP